MKALQGVVHGKTIHLADDAGLDDGTNVEVVLRPLNPPRASCDGLRRCDTALAGIPGLDEDIEEILRQRRSARFREVDA